MTNLFPITHAVAAAIGAGVPVNTITLLLLLPLVAALIAAARNIIGIRGFGIFLPAALSVVFVAIGPVLGLGLFLAIVVVSTLVRFFLRTIKVRLLYLPRMAIILWSVVLGVLGILFLTPVVNLQGLANVSVFAVLILTLLAEDFTRVQLGKSVRTAVDLTVETIILAFASYLVLTLTPIQSFAIQNPEILLIGVLIFDFVLGRYSGLRLMEILRFRKLITS